MNKNISKILPIKISFYDRSKKLHKVLNIPEGNRLISQLSGGEQRRTSLSIALLNNSSLLILDEPTVGIDMIITSQIWDYLCDRCNEGLTILFVTQYVEEATHANRIGFMRNGKLLVEDKPSVLMEKYNEQRLEKIFLELCLIEDNKSGIYSNLNNNEIILVDSDEHIHKIRRTSPRESKTSTNFWILLILIARNISKIRRMGFPSLLIVLLPAIQALVFCLVFNKQLIEV